MLTGAPPDRSHLAAGALIAALAGLPGLACARDGCLGDDATCTVPSPCEELAFTCDAGSAEIRRVERPEDLVAGPFALGSLGDFRLANDRVVAIIEALDHPHYLAPSGGMLIDFTTQGGPDAMPQMSQVTGVLPGDAFFYDDARMLEGDGFAALQLRGHLAGQPALRVATRYELRPCEPGLRIRSEIVNAGPEPLIWTIADGFYWGGRRNIPFVPGEGRGFEHISFGLTTLNEAFEDAPYLVASTYTDPSVSYAHVMCSARAMSGFHGQVISVTGTARQIVMPGDYLVSERFLAVGDTPAVSSAADHAMELRRQLFDEPFVTLRGQVKVDGQDPSVYLGAGLRAAVLVSRGTTDTPDNERDRVTHTTPDADGNFAVRVSPGASYVLEVEAYGQKVDELDVDVGADDLDAGPLSVPPVGQLTVDVTVDGASDHAQLILYPADDVSDGRVRGRMFTAFDECAPLLGHPYSGAPACNRVLTQGPTTFAVPPGSYDVFATVGPFATVARARKVVVKPGAAVDLDLALTSLPQPPGTLSADLHVHGASSIDSAIPELDRVRAFLAARVQVIVSTDHDVVADYAEGIAATDATARMRLITGTESTGDILFKLLPNLPYPQVTGHWNLWPIPYRPTAPWRGAAWDELAEPGTLFTRMRKAGWDADTGVAQLNHPLDSPTLGRDLGWGRTIHLNLLDPLVRVFDASAPSLFLRTPPGAEFSNADYHAQEVMNGTSNRRFLLHRELWFYLLNEGIVRTGTANSDSHSLSDEIIGSPRNLVTTPTTVADFDPVAFNRAVRAGHVLGTNGPIIHVETTDQTGSARGPALQPFTPAADARLHITVQAAPWVPVEEVRVIVNGELVRSIDQLQHPVDPLGAEGFLRLDTQLALADLLPPAGDAWLVVEAGARLEPHADFNCDGIPDTGDNNRDGKVDWRDVDGLDADPGDTCFSGGPLTAPEPPTDRDSGAYLFWAVVAEGYPAAFTNPLILDRDGGGYHGVAR